MTMTECKANLVAAHRTGDEPAMRKWSQVRERLKRHARRFARCRVCAITIKRGKRFCQMHGVMHRVHGIGTRLTT